MPPIQEASGAIVLGVEEVVPVVLESIGVPRQVVPTVGSESVELQAAEEHDHEAPMGLEYGNPDGNGKCVRKQVLR